jgi:DNA (cytosine-5)-methyltransferase 1
MADSPPLVVDLFCGAGGFSLGFHAAGCRIIGAADADRMAAETYRRNFGLLQTGYAPHVPENGDLEETDPDLLAGGQQPDIVIGGPPCQAFSRLGRAKLNSLSDEGFRGDPRNVLYRRFLAAVERWKPLALVVENVPGMLTVGGVNYADIVCAEIAATGYHTGYALLNSVWYGVPQLRERLFFIGIREDLGLRPAAPPTAFQAELPEGYSRPLREVHRSLPFGGGWDRNIGPLAVPASPREAAAVTVREALDDLPGLTDHLTPGRRPRGEFRQHLPYRSAPLSWYATLMRYWPGFTPPTGVEDHAIRRTPRDYETFRRMRPGDRFPEALAIARAIRDEELARLQAAGAAPDPGTQEWEEFEARFVPPYDEHEFTDKWRKLIPDRPSWTVPAHLAKDSYSHIHYDDAQARMISIREAARLQSFPDAFSFAGNMGDCFRQIGNAVPPLLARAVAEAVLGVLGQFRE